MRYLRIVFISIIGILFINGYEKKSDSLKAEKPNNSVSKNEIIKKDSNTVNDKAPKRCYRKDAAKVDTFPYFADYKGYRYYFPCGPCRDKFIQEREEYLEKWRKKGRKIRKRKLE